MIYEMQPDDPTMDELMCFYKPPLHPTRDENTSTRSSSSSEPRTLFPNSMSSTDTLSALMSNLPGLLLDVIGNVADHVESSWPLLLSGITKAVGRIPDVPQPGTMLVVKQITDQIESLLKIMVKRFRPILASASAVEENGKVR